MGTPSLKKLYEDDDGIVVSFFYEGKYTIHSEYFCDASKLSFLKKAKRVSKAVTASFKQIGVDNLYTWSETDQQERYNKFLGYVPTGEYVIIPKYPNPLKEWIATE